MTDIESLTLRVHDLSQTVDFWNLFTLWSLAVTALAAFVVGVSTRLVIIRGGQMAAVQHQLGHAKDLVAQADLRERDRLVAVATRDVAAALGSTATYQKAAAVAETEQERVRIDLAAQQERAAQAERTVEELKLAAQPRELKSDTKVKLVENLRPVPKVPILIDFVLGNLESQSFATQIAAVFGASGWSSDGIRVEPKFFAANPVGIGFAVTEEVGHPAAADQVQLAFQNSGFLVSGFSDPSAPKGTLVVLVGLKKPAQAPTFLSR